MSYNRRLPIYLLIDCSESMAGEPFEGMVKGVDLLLDQLKSNPMALETVAISVIAFSNRAEQIAQLQDIIQFNRPNMHMGSGTALGDALNLLEKCMVTEIIKTTERVKGDWKPICFVFSDGAPTDNWAETAKRIKTTIDGKKATIISIACGPDADVEALKQISNTVLRLKNLNAEALKSCFKWVSASVSTVSSKIEGEGSPVQLPGFESGMMEIIDNNKKYERPICDKYVFLHARCENTKQFYIMRYIKDGEHYRAVAAHPIEDFDFGTDGEEKSTLSTENLLNNPPCPYCGNEYWAMCNCGKVFCVNDDDTHTCPWCNETADYSFSNFDVGQAQG